VHEILFVCFVLYGIFLNSNIITKQEPVEPGDAPREGFGHRKVYKKMNKGQKLQN
jgi:hypothetical protein